MRPFVFALAVLIVGCAPRLDAGAVGPDARPSARALAAVADSLASAPLPRRAESARRALSRAGATPLADGGQTARWTALSDGAPSAAAFVPGRDPLARNELVVLSADLDGMGAAATLEAVRILVERSRWRTAPERSVEVMLWRGASPNAAQTALWARPEVRAVLVVGDAAPVADSLAVESLPVTGDGLALAGRIVERVTELARRPAPPASGAPSDTLIVR